MRTFVVIFSGFVVLKMNVDEIEELLLVISRLAFNGGTRLIISTPKPILLTTTEVPPFESSSGGSLTLVVHSKWLARMEER